MRIMTLHPCLLPLFVLGVLQLAFISGIVSIEYVLSTVGLATYVKSWCRFESQIEPNTLSQSHGGRQTT